MYDAVFHIGDFAYDMDWVWYNTWSLHKCLFPMGSSFILYPCWVGAHGNLYIVTVCYLLCILVWFLIIPDSSSRALWQWLPEISNSERGETWWRNGCWFLPAECLFHTHSVL
jgi:hypothetical protein